MNSQRSVSMRPAAVMKIWVRLPVLDLIAADDGMKEVDQIVLSKFLLGEGLLC